MEKIVLDAHAATVFFLNEPGAGEVEKILKDARAGNIPVLINAVNLGEVFYAIRRKIGTDEAMKACEVLESMRVNIVSADKEISILAGSLKNEKKMSYADCFAAATALMFEASLVTGDKEFKEVEKEIKILWI